MAIAIDVYVVASQGPAGETGPVGTPGVQGAKGEKGFKGATGASGQVGPAVSVHTPLTSLLTAQKIISLATHRVQWAGKA